MIVRMKPSELIDELEDFRGERVGLITNNEQPIRLSGGAKFVLHVVPNTAFDRTSLEATVFDVSRQDVVPMASSGWSHKINFDGIAAVESEGEKFSCYVQLFHNGVIEAVNARYFVNSNDRMYIPITSWREELAQRLPNYLNIERSLGVKPPVYVLVTLIGVKGYRLADQRNYARSIGNEIDRDDLMIPAVRIESFDYRIDEVLAPIFDRILNAGGLRSHAVES